MQSVEGVPLPKAFQNVVSSNDEIRPGKKARRAVDKTGPPPSRLSLRLQAAWWRSLQRIGMSLHFLAPPQPPSHSFTKTIPSTLSNEKGDITLYFYLPKDFDSTKKTYPTVVNFHGGGFTLGDGTDDARFARFVLEGCNAIFVSVNYRLAPEYPFPTAMDDGADAILYLIRHAAELRINPQKLATSGFSAGGNVAITALLRLAAHRTSAQPSSLVPDHKIVALATWYPITDYTISRADRRATSKRPDQTLPPVLTNLFDGSYLHPPDLNLANPYLSPSKASDDQLIQAIPSHVLFYTCEWDMLLREGEDLAKRLAKSPVRKDVYYKMIPEVPHGWDKGPSPLTPPPQSEDLYRDCCRRLKNIFDGASAK